MELDVVVNEIRHAKAELQKVGNANSYINILDSMIEKAEEPLMVMVMGEFSTGKSTFINALIGEEITTVGATETTAVITEICYGRNDTVLVHLNNGEIKEYSPLEFSKLTAQQGVSGTDAIHENIEYVERRMPLSFLRDITIIDSPGLNTTVATHQELTENFIKNADTVLWMFNVEKAVSRTEQKAIEKLDSRLKPIAIVNKMDQFEEEEECTEEEFISGIEKKLQDKVSAVIGISAMFAIKGKKEKRADLIKASNIGKLQQVIDEKIIPNRDDYKINSLADDLGCFVDECMKDVAEKNKSNKQYENTDYSKYVANKRLTVAITDTVGKCMQSMSSFFNDNKLNYSAVYLKALDYYWGIISEQNLEKAEELLEKAALNSHLRAQISLIRLYCDLKMDEKAVYWLDNISTQDNYNNELIAEILYKLGLMYFNGDGRDKSIEKGLELIEKSAVKNYLKAQEFLVAAYENGNGVHKSTQKTIYWLEKIAATENVNAKVKVAGMYYADKDYKQAIHWYEKAAKQNNAEALYMLGSLHLSDDILAAKKYFTKALEAKNYKAALELGKIYYQNEQVFANNLKYAQKYFKIAVENGISGSIKLLNDTNYALSEQAKDAKLTAVTLPKEQCVLGDEFFEQGDIARALKAYTLAANGNLAEAQYKAAAILSKNLKFRDLKTAFLWYEKAANQGNIESVYELAGCYNFAYGVSKDVIKAVELYKKALTGKKYQAALDLAKIYYLDNATISQNLTLMANYLNIAKQHNIAGTDEWFDKLNALRKQREIEAQIRAATTPEAKYETGRRFWHHGEYELALKMLNQAADEGSVYAMLDVGHIYLNGDKVAEDKNEAFRRFTQAAEQNNVHAQNMLGRCFSEGWGCEVDLDKANLYFKKAAALNDASAQYNLGMNYLYAEGLPKDYKKALSWFKLSAENGAADAYARIAYCYLCGYGVPINAEKAQELLAEATRRGSKLPEEWAEKLPLLEEAAKATTATEVFAIADKLWDKELYGEAIELYTRVADAGYISAQVKIADIRLRLKENDEAFAWYMKAAQNGNAEAQNMLGRCFSEGWGTAVDLEQATSWFAMAANNGNVSAQYNLAVCYEEGKGCSASTDKAKEWLSKAAESGDEDAKKRLAQYAATTSSGCLLPILVTVAVIALLII